MNHEANSSGVEERNGACSCPDCRLPPQGPPAWLRDKAVAIWCGTYYAELATEMGQDAAAHCAGRALAGELECALAAGHLGNADSAVLQPADVQ